MLRLLPHLSQHPAAGLFELVAGEKIFPSLRQARRNIYPKSKHPLVHQRMDSAPCAKRVDCCWLALFQIEVVLAAAVVDRVGWVCLPLDQTRFSFVAYIPRTIPLGG